MDLKETQLDTDVVYDGGFIKVRKDHARMPDGSTSVREYIEHPGAVAVLAMLDNGKLARSFGLRLPDWRTALALVHEDIDAATP